MSAASGYSLFVQDHCNNNNNDIDGCALAWGQLTHSDRNRYAQLRAQNESEAHEHSLSTSSHKRVGGHGEIINSAFSYFSTNVAKTMTKNGWSESFIELMRRYVKVTSGIQYHQQILLKALAITQAELVDWVQIPRNRDFLANIIVLVLRGCKETDEVPPVALQLDTTYAILQNPTTNWNNMNLIDRIRPIYLVHASLLAGGDDDLIWWLEHEAERMLDDGK